VFALQSYDQLRAVFDEYDQQSKFGAIDASLEHELSGQFRDAMRLIVSIARGQLPDHYARRLRRATKGICLSLCVCLRENHCECVFFFL
jgi:hypothetical protein